MAQIVFRVFFPGAERAQGGCLLSVVCGPRRRAAKKPTLYTAQPRKSVSIKNCLCTNESSTDTNTERESELA